VSQRGPSTSNAVVFVYDASCVLCSRSANFVAKRDREGRFHYADASSGPGQELLRAHGLDTETLDAVIIIDGAKTYAGSTASLRIVVGKAQNGGR